MQSFDAPTTLRILLDVTTALTASLDLDVVLGEMLIRTVRLADAAAGTLFLVDADGLPTRKIAARGGAPYAVDPDAVGQVFERGLARWVFEHGAVARVDDVGVDARWLRLPDPNPSYEARSAVCVPVVRHGRTLGILTLTHGAPGHFTADLVELLVAVATQAAVAIENARLFGEVQRLATTDGLTGLANRRHFFERAEALVAAAGPFAVLMADVDHFKSINDGSGHAAGDEVLAAVAARLRDGVRAGAGASALVGRYGGEEFAALLPGTDRASAAALAEALRAHVADAPVATSRGPLRVTLSLGVAAAPEDARDLAGLLRRADDRLYAAKRSGRNRVASEG